LQEPLVVIAPYKNVTVRTHLPLMQSVISQAGTVRASIADVSEIDDAILLWIVLSSFQRLKSRLQLAVLVSDD